MRIDKFELEEWLNPRHSGSRYNLGVSCVKAITVEELLKVTGVSTAVFLDELKGAGLHCGPFNGSERLRSAISSLYECVTPGDIITAHGGADALGLAITALVEPGDSVVAIVPNYQQHYSIPASLGAQVRCIRLDRSDDYTLNLDSLSSAVDSGTRLITFSNPNNPTGKFFGRETLRSIADIAGSVGAYVLSDEICRGLDERYMPSMADVYDKAVVTGGMSKVFSMAGARVGWIVTRDRPARAAIENRRAYGSGCDGPIDGLLAAIALENQEKVLARSRSIVSANRAIFEAWLADFPSLASRRISHGATALVHYDYDVPSDELCSDVYAKLGVLLCHGECFDEEKCFRLGYGYLDPTEFAKGLELLGRYFKTLDRRSSYGDRDSQQSSGAVGSQA